MCLDIAIISFLLRLGPVEYWKWVSLGVENPLLQRNNIIVQEQEVEIFECLSQEVTDVR